MRTSAVLLLTALLGSVGGCDRAAPDATSPPIGTDRGDGEAAAGGGASGASAAGLASRIRLVDVTTEVGLDFRHRTGSEGSYPMPAIMGGGAAIFDYDGDGLLDLYLVQAGDRFPANGLATGTARDSPRAGPSADPASGATSDDGNRLFRQDRDGRFADVTATSGLGDRGYGMGVAVGDIDNDGDLDVFVTNWGPDALYRNQGDGRFTDATTRAGVGGGPAWSASAAFLDYDRDGLLDLYVTRYVAFDPRHACAAEGGRPDYCGPVQFEGLPDELFHNLGDGRFEEVGRQSGIARVEAAGLGLVTLDLDDDGWIDVYVANDADPNNLWLNQHDGRFVDDGVLLGAAFNRQGIAEAGMGVVAGDADGDGDADLFVSHLIEETNTFYSNQREALGFEDTTAAVGLGLGSVGYTGFGDALADLDDDGDLDLAVVNGGIKRRPSDLLGRSGWFWSAYAEPNLLFDNRGDGTFVGVEGGAGDYGVPIEVSRGLVAADIDGDGDLDLLVTNVEGPARLYRNEGGSKLSWVEIRVVDPRSGGREAVGARVTVVAPTRRYLRNVGAAGGYLTAVVAPLHVGLGDDESVERFEVRWPDGLEEVFPGGAARRLVELRRGDGEAR